MNTPIRDFVKNYAGDDAVRLHMPGHKGKNFLGCEKYDITEIDGADVLYSASGIIKESEENASKLFGTYRTFYSAEGSSLCIKAMLAMVMSERKKDSMRPYILAARNVHKAFIYACALLDLDVEWLIPENNGHLCSCNISAEDVRKKLKKCDTLPIAVYVTSPDYLGTVLDIKAIAGVCDEIGVPLLVDNAHGAYLHFLKEKIHPIDLGAYMCCDSAHKTLPVLTGGAYLHLSYKAKSFADTAENMLSVFASTSPSYLILQSLDLCNEYLFKNYESRLLQTVKLVDELKKQLKASGFEVEASEPLKIVVNSLKSGFNTYYAIELLRKSGIEVEFYDKNYIVMMFSPENAEIDFKRTLEAFSLIECQTDLKKATAPSDALIGKKAMSIRNAIFENKEILEISKSVGRICACPAVSCPPAVPIVISGERISENAVILMQKYGIERIEVVKES